MLTDTRISTFLIPNDLWTDGSPARPDLPPLSVPAADALDIERRAGKRVGLRNEYRRYTLCCERIQGIVRELAQTGCLQAPVVWPASPSSDDGNASARVYLALVEVFSVLLAAHENDVRDKLDGRTMRPFRLFIPPSEVEYQSSVAERQRSRRNLEQIFVHAANVASLPGTGISISPQQCRQAFERRCELLRHAANILPHGGLVDLTELA